MTKKSAPNAAPSYQEAEAALLAAEGGATAAAPGRKSSPDAAARRNPPPARRRAVKEVAEVEDEPAEKTKAPAGGKKKAAAAKAKKEDDHDPVADVKSRLFGGSSKPARQTTSKVEDEEDDEEEELAAEHEEEDEPAPPRRRIPVPRNDAEDDEDEEDESPRRSSISDDTLMLAEESGMTRSELRDEIERLGSERAVVAMLSRARRFARRMNAPQDDLSPQRREEQQHREEEVRRPAASTDEDVDFDKDFSLEGEWGEDTKLLIDQLTKHVSPRIRALAKKTEAALKRLEAHEQRVNQREAMEQQRQLDRCFAEAGPQYAELFGKVATRKLPAGSAYAANRDEIVDEMVAINQMRARRGLDLLEMEELFRTACDRVHPHLVEERLQQRKADEVRSVRGTPQLRGAGRRPSLPLGRERAMQTLEEKRKEYGRD